jgi:hypothetical protein
MTSLQPDFDFGITITLRTGVKVQWTLMPTKTWRWGVANATNRSQEDTLWFKTRSEAIQFARERFDNGPVVYCKYCATSAWRS